MRARLLALTAVLAVCSFAIGSSAALGVAKPKPSAGPFAEFKACMQAHGAPSLRGHKLSTEERAALKQAFAACRSLLPKPTGNPGGRKHPHARPTAAQVAAFKTCMADKGFSASNRPDLHDPAVRTALRAAFKTCLPLLKPASP
jgi:hypothetical protein